MFTPLQLSTTMDPFDPLEGGRFMILYNDDEEVGLHFGSKKE